MEKIYLVFILIVFSSVFLICGITLLCTSLKKEIYYLKQARMNEKAQVKALHWFVWGIQGGLGFIGLALAILIVGIILFIFNKDISEGMHWIILISTIFIVQWLAGRLLKHLYKKYY